MVLINIENMKKLLILPLIMLFLFVGCEKDVFDINPQMESFYVESVHLTSASADSIESFSYKVDGFSKSYPWAVEHERYPQIRENIRVASLRFSLSIDGEWRDSIITYF